MVTLREIAQAYINTIHGWAVASQFESIYFDFSDENLSKQNSSALQDIYEALMDLCESDALSDEAVQDLADYKDFIWDYLNAPVKEDEA